MLVYNLGVKQVNMHEAKTHLSRLVEEVAAGDTIVLAKAGKPMVRMVALQAAESASLDEQSLSATGGEAKMDRRRFGFMKGKVKFAPDFDDPLPEEILQAFEGGASKDPV